MELSNKDKVMDISVNLARVSDWILSDNESRQRRIDRFLQEIKEYLATMDDKTFHPRFQRTLQKFKGEFASLIIEKDSAEKYDWAERALTWANILQHRASLV